MARAIIRPFSRKLRTELLGHGDIDADHVEISDCWFQAVNCTPIQFPFLIARMKKLMVKHFAREDDIMARVDAALCSCHRQEHDMLIGLCDRAARLSKYDWRATQRLLRDEFPKLVREHIICMDQLLVLHLNTCGGSAPTDKSRRGDYLG
jgi:hemerythrin